MGFDTSTRSSTGTKQARLAIVGLSMLVAFFVRDPLVSGRVFYVRDIHLQWFGQVESFVHAVANGNWPLWDPYVSFGQPLLANANAQLLYPPTWLNLVMRPWTYYTVFLAGHLLFSAVGIYALARRWGISPWGAFVAAAFWLSSGPVLSLGNLWNHLAAAAWAPWALLAAEVALDQPAVLPTLAWGTCLAMPILAGSPEVLLATLLLTAGRVISRIARAGPTSSPSRHAIAVAVAAGAFALALSAAQSLPSFDVATRSDRWALAREERTYWSIHPLGLLQIPFPVLWNDVPLSAGLRAELFESREPLLFSVYLGLPLLALAAASFAGDRRGPRLGLAAVAAAAALAALGRHTPLYDALVAVVPMARGFRFPAKALVLVAFAASLLAGMGFDELQSADSQRRRRVVLLVVPAVLAAAVVAAWAATGVTFATEAWGARLVGPIPSTLHYADALAVLRTRMLRTVALAVVVAAAALTHRHRRIAAWLVVGLGLLDLGALHRNLNPTAPRTLYIVPPPALGHLTQTDFGRLFVYDYTMTPERSRRFLHREAAYLVPAAAGGEERQWLGALGIRAYMAPPTGAPWRVFESFTRDSLGIQPTPLAELNAVLAYADGTPLADRLLRMGAVSQVSALHTEGFERLTPEDVLDSPFPEPIRLFHVPHTLPRSYAVSGVRVADDRAADDLLLAPDLDPAREVILPQGRAQPPTPGFSGESRILEMAADRVRLEARLSAPGYVVLVDAYDPGWRVEIDGRPAPLLRANLGFRAVPTPAGTHLIEMRYRPRPFLIGAGISAASALLGLAFVARDVARRRPRFLPAYP